MIITAEITGIKYTPRLGRELRTYHFSSLEKALSTDASFLLRLDSGNTIAVSWWVSSKRTRSYPYARVYDTLSFSGKKITIVPIFKDEGADGDRDFLQWDTISLMSLLGVYVVIGYYTSASRNPSYKNKITDQRFDIEFLKEQINEILPYQSDALHWNLSQIDKAGELARKALEAYDTISRKLGVQMHSSISALQRISELSKGKENFMAFSRRLAKKAQLREIATNQPKERLSGIKAPIIIRNYLGGAYFFTVDEARLQNGKLLLIEGKHTKNNRLPSLEDIKDGLLKMILYTNLTNVVANSRKMESVAVLLLTTGTSVNDVQLSRDENFERLKEEARSNGFLIMLNDKYVKL
jgi:hypothetical protein